MFYNFTCEIRDSIDLGISGFDCRLDNDFHFDQRSQIVHIYEINAQLLLFYISKRVYVDFGRKESDYAI